MKRSELIENYSKLLHIKNYAPQTEKSYLHHLNLFSDYVKNSKVTNVNADVLLNYFNNLKQEKLFSYSSMKQSLAAIRFLYLDVLKKEIDFDFFVKMKNQIACRMFLQLMRLKKLLTQ